MYENIELRQNRLNGCFPRARSVYPGIRVKDTIAETSANR
jgi:hypothetical protein